MKLLPDWVYILAIILLVAGIGGQEIRIARGELLLSREKRARDQDTIERQKLVIKHATELLEIQLTHSTKQQKDVEQYEAQISASKTAAATERARADRVSRDLSRYTASGARPGETDAAACSRATDRLPLVGALLGEVIELGAEGRALIRQRDSEVELLLNQIQTDRAACAGSPVKKPEKQ